MRTQTLVKNAIIQVDANPFKQWYQQHYGSEVGIKKRQAAAAAEEGDKAEEKGPSNHVKRKLEVCRLAFRGLRVVQHRLSIVVLRSIWSVLQI